MKLPQGVMTTWKSDRQKLAAEQEQVQRHSTIAYAFSDGAGRDVYDRA